MSSFANIANINLSEFSIAAVKNAANEIRAQVYPKNDTERKVYEALSSKNWGASSSLMAEIAQETYQRDKYSFIMEILKVEDGNKSLKH